MHPREIDANLLIRLDALLQTESVQEAADRLHLSPSATSHALARLREVFDDPLLVRAGNELVKTTRAEQLEPHIRRWVSEMSALLEPEEGFDPETLDRPFSISATDHIEFSLLPDLHRRLDERAPGVDLYSQPYESDIEVELRDGELDAGIGVYDELGSDLESQTLFEDAFVVVMREGHPRAPDLTLRQYTQCEHVLIAPRGTPRGYVDEVLDDRGRERRVKRTVSSFLSAPFLIETSDVIITMPRRVARRAAKFLDVTLLAPPLELGAFEVDLVWHRRHAKDPAHRWLRNQVFETAEAMPSLEDLRTE